MKDALPVHIQIDVAALGYDRKQIWLVKPFFDSRTGTSLQDIRGFAIKSIELIGPVYFDGVVVERTLCSNLAKEHPTSISFEDGHLYFIGEVTEGNGLSITCQNMSLQGLSDMITPSRK